MQPVTPGFADPSEQARMPNVFSLGRLAQWTLRKKLLVGAAIGLIAALSAEGSRMLFGANAHTVLEGRIYRSAQPNPDDLVREVRRHGIRTVINLRGCCYPFPWYCQEACVTRDLDIAQEDITLSANRLPAASELRRLVEVLDRAEYPILIHCRRGADRTGLISALALLLLTDADLETARIQCSPRYGHVRILTTAFMDKCLDMYEGWLHSQGLTHTPDHLRQWIAEVYCPGPGHAEFEAVEPNAVYPVGIPSRIAVRITNESHEVWHFVPGTRLKIQLNYTVVGEKGEPIVVNGSAGHLRKDVRPGEAIDLSLPIPALPHAGRYYLYADLADKHVSFSQLGSPIFTHELIAR